jgi:hypothetical protein
MSKEAIDSWTKSFRWTLCRAREALFLAAALAIGWEIQPVYISYRPPTSL